MFLQKEYIREGVSMTLNSTYVLDLPENGLLTSLFMRISGAEASGLGQSGGSWRIEDFISKVEIIANGATVIKSLAAREIKALAFYDQGICSPDSLRNYATNTQFSYLFLNFGRKLMDKELGLDLSKFQSVELKITNTATSSEFSDLTVSTVGLFMRDYQPSALKGYMRTEEFRSWTTVADETKYFDLPIEHVLRRIMLTAIPDVDANYVSEDNIYNYMDDIQLDLDTGQIRVFKGGLDDLIRQNAYEYGRIPQVSGANYNFADKGWDAGLGYVFGGVFGISSKDTAVATSFATRTADQNYNTQTAESYEADSPIDFIVTGLAYQNTAMLRFDYDEDMGMWLDPNVRKSVKLNIHTKNAAADADGTNKVVLDRLVKY